MSNFLSKSAKARGFTIIELLMVVLIVGVLTAVATVNVLGSLKNSAADGASQLIVQQLRLARQFAISDRHIYRLSFYSPSGLTLDKLNSDNSYNSTIVTNVIPTTVSFSCPSGIPPVPDNILGDDGSQAIYFQALNQNNDGNQIYFQPDGAGRDANGRLINGVIYTSVGGNLSTARSVSIFGSTGRIKAWKLYGGPGNWYWQ